MALTREARLGCVVIGRNEGDRLRSCLESVVAQCTNTVYVDSASSDDSVALARSHSVAVHELDPATSFSAARARNEGLKVLRERSSDLEFVQFVDGDCEIADGWLSAGVDRLREDRDLAVVIGRARERRVDASVYNHLADIEWDVSVGEIQSCGGVAMMRLCALEQAGNYDADLIAGEESELCLRLRHAGWRLECLGAEMMVHDLAMTRFDQWWYRVQRAGYAYANGAFLHGRGIEGFRVREVRRIVAWGGILPLFTLAAAIPTKGLALVLVFGYAWPFRGAYRIASARGRSRAEAWLYGFWCTLGKLPEFHGFLRFQLDRMLSRQGSLIEHK